RAATAGTNNASATVARLSQTHQRVALRSASGPDRRPKLNHSEGSKQTTARVAPHSPSPLQKRKPSWKRLQGAHSRSPAVAATAQTSTENAAIDTLRTIKARMFHTASSFPTALPSPRAAAKRHLVSTWTNGTLRDSGVMVSNPPQDGTRGGSYITYPSSS